MKVSVLIRQLAEQTRALIDKRFGELDAMVKSLPVPKDGKDGIDAPPLEAICAMVKAQMPVPKDGKDGTSVTIDDVKPLIDELAKSIPLPKDGRDGIDGKDGIDGVDGKSITFDEVEALVSKAIGEYQTKWALDMERRSQEVFQRAIERIPVPKDGNDGRDAVDVDGFDVAQEGKSMTLSLMRDGVVVSQKTVRIPGFEDRGVWRDGVDYEKGDGVSFGGSFFIAQKDQPEGKPEQSKDWRCAVKRGRDGKDVVHIPRDPNAPVKTR